MNRLLYIILIVFLVLSTAAEVWTFVFAFHLGSEIYKLESYVSWFFVVNITAFAGSILLLKYYYDQNYRIAFFTGVIAVIADLAYTAIFYVGLTSGQLTGYAIPALLVYLSALVLYSASLICSKTRGRIWLQLAGVCGMVIGLVVLFALVDGMYSKNAWFITTLGKITRWTPIAGQLVNVMFIINFVSEIRTLKTGNTNIPGRRYLTGASALSVLAIVILMVTTARSLVNESNSHIDWRQFTSAQAGELVGLAGKPRTYVDSEGDSLHYLLIKPMDYDSSKKYPLVVCLPYGGYEAGAAESLSSDANRYNYRAFIFVPWCPEGEGWGGIRGYPSLESLVYDAIGKLDEPGIDVKRRYVTGVSRGGFGTWKFICTRPDLFAAAVPVCGKGDPAMASKVVHMPIWAFHGAKDINVPVSGSRDMIAAIKKAGGHPLYTEYPNSAHNIWENVIETPDVWNWLFAQRQK